MKSVLKKIGFTIFCISTLTIVLAWKNPEEMTMTNYKEVITEKVIENFATTYADINQYNIEKEEERIKNLAVYEDKSYNELVNLLNRSLNSTIANQGSLIATHSLKLGIDPVLATAIILQETGCKWQCSYLVEQCNNVGGIKGSPSCGGYKKYSSLEEGITGFLDNLYTNYYSYGLTTPEKMNSKYAQSKTWAEKVNAYVREIKAKG